VEKSERNKLKAAYKTFHATVSAIFSEEDPLALLDNGSPSDEYDMEVAGLLPRLKHCQSEKQVARAIAEVLSESFGEEYGSEPPAKLTGKVCQAMIDANWRDV
jgi:hypothetical protein